MSAPIRTCVGCSRRAPQTELVRFVSVAGTLTPDPERLLPGRGAYSCRSLGCVEAAIHRRGFARTLRSPLRLPEELLERLTEAVSPSHG